MAANTLAIPPAVPPVIIPMSWWPSVCHVADSPSERPNTLGAMIVRAFSLDALSSPLTSLKGLGV